MSANRYMIKVFDSYGQKSLTFKLKTVVGNKEDFIKEIIDHIVTGKQIGRAHV